MTEAATIAAAREAWQRLQGRDRMAWEDWLAVGHALVIGRASCLKVAGRNDPVGIRYNRAMVAWLRGNGLSGINNQERYRALLIIEHLPEIEQWRGGLDEAQRGRLNHPNAVWTVWQRATRPRHITKGKAFNGSGRLISWPQSALRRAVVAIREANSNDVMMIAKAALYGAIRTEADLLELIPPAPPAKSTTRAANGAAHYEAA